MNVRRLPSRIPHRFDRAEIILAGGTRQEAAEALEVRVEPGLVGTIRKVNAIVIHAPNLNRGVAERIALRIEQSPAQVRDLANGGGGINIDDEKVAICGPQEVG